ncbi:hypothetical protein D3C86_1775650 [compost metagenome]
MAFDGHLDLAVHDIKRLVPRVKVRRWSASLHAFLDMHLKGFAQVPTGKDGNRLANDNDGAGDCPGFDDVDLAHDGSPTEGAAGVEYRSAGAGRTSPHRPVCPGIFNADGIIVPGVCSAA